MKKLLFLSAAVLLTFSSCEKSDDGCKCKGEFGRGGTSSTWYANNVDCDTGEPALSRNHQDSYFIRCVK